MGQVSAEVLLIIIAFSVKPNAEVGIVSDHVWDSPLTETMIAFPLMVRWSTGPQMVH